MLTSDERQVAALAIRDKLEGLGAFVLVVAMSGQHAHLIAKLPPSEARNLVGRAKKHVYFELRDRGHVGHVWGKSSKETPIDDRGHQVNEYHYVPRHREQAAYVWSWVEEHHRRKGDQPAL